MLAGVGPAAKPTGRLESTPTHCLGAALLQFLGEVRDLERLATVADDRAFYRDQIHRAAMWLVDLHDGSPAAFVAGTIVNSRVLVSWGSPDGDGYALASRQLQARARRVMELKE